MLGPLAHPLFVKSFRMIAFYHHGNLLGGVISELILFAFRDLVLFRVNID